MSGASLMKHLAVTRRRLFLIRPLYVDAARGAALRMWLRPSPFAR